MDDNQNLAVDQELVDKYMWRLPRSYVYDDYIWPGLLISPERLQEMRDMKFRPTDILIASYPKSGTTWVSELVSLIAHRGDFETCSRKQLHERVPWLELDEGYMWVRFFWIWQVISKLLGILPAPTSSEKCNEIPRVFFTHLPMEMLPKYVLDGGCKIIYVARNPKDNAVSFFHFHQMARYLGLQKTTWDEFFPLYASGQLYCGSWFEHVLGYNELSKVNPNVLFLKFEEMKKDLYAETRRICKFLEFDLSQDTMKAIAQRCQFSSMKDNKMVNREGIWLFNHKISQFMRKGVVGDWKNYFTVVQDAIFDDIYKHKMADVDLKFEFEL